MEWLFGQSTKWIVSSYIGDRRSGSWTCRKKWKRRCGPTQSSKREPMVIGSGSGFCGISPRVLPFRLLRRCSKPAPPDHFANGQRPAIGVKTRDWRHVGRLAGFSRIPSANALPQQRRQAWPVRSFLRRHGLFTDWSPFLHLECGLWKANAIPLRPAFYIPSPRIVFELRFTADHIRTVLLGKSTQVDPVKGAMASAALLVGDGGIRVRCCP
jgi:hypothetical protein